jgi:hypothetical protein
VVFLLYSDFWFLPCSNPEFIACHVALVVKKEKPFQDTFAETLCYNMMLGEVVLSLVASMYV